MILISLTCECRFSDSEMQRVLEEAQVQYERYLEIALITQAPQAPPEPRPHATYDWDKPLSFVMKKKKPQTGPTTILVE